jgi:hypothetical protein
MYFMDTLKCWKMLENVGVHPLSEIALAMIRQTYISSTLFNADFRPCRIFKNARDVTRVYQKQNGKDFVSVFIF